MDDDEMRDCEMDGYEMRDDMVDEMRWYFSIFLQFFTISFIHYLIISSLFLIRCVSEEEREETNIRR